MKEKLETVRIVHGDGYCVINKEDFDEELHKEFKGKIEAQGTEGDDESESEDEEDAAETDPVEEARLNAIVIPENWKDEKHLTLWGIAKDIAGKPVEKGSDIVLPIIERELARREKAAS